MQQHLLYIVAPDELVKTKEAMERLEAKEQPSISGVTQDFVIKHRFLGNMILNVSFLCEVDRVAQHMRECPVDLLVYDERGENWAKAVDAIRHIKHEVRKLGDTWGPDFYFPMSRVVAVLSGDEKDSHMGFELGRLQVRDVYVGPKTTAAILRWLKDILNQGIVRESCAGVALSGGGLDGFLYQVGVIFAMQCALRDKSLADCDAISGVSSGAIAGALLASHGNVREMIRAFYGRSKLYPHFASSTLFDLAGKSISKRIIRESLQWSLNPTTWPTKLIKSIPTGFFKGEALEEYFKAVIETSSGGDTFEGLKSDLFVGATDQDSFEHVTFGIKPFDKVAVSEALRASCAFPPIFAPKSIQGRRYIDGQVTKSCNFEVAVDRGARLVFVIDPLKPFATAQAGVLDEQGGFFGVVQTIKALVSTRFEQHLQHVSSQYPDVDFIVFQPDAHCAQLMAGSPMRYRIRTQIIEAAYRATLQQLRERYHVYSVKMARFGFNLRSPQKLKELADKYDDIFNATS